MCQEKKHLVRIHYRDHTGTDEIKLLCITVTKYEQEMMIHGRAAFSSFSQTSAVISDDGSKNHPGIPTIRM